MKRRAIIALALSAVFPLAMGLSAQALAQSVAQFGFAAQPTERALQNVIGPEWSAISARLSAIVQRESLAGMSVIVMKGNDVLYKQHFGNYDDTTRIHVASASKWVVGALAMRLVDDNLIKLDDPISAHLTIPIEHGKDITLRQLLSYTAGQGSLLGQRDFLQPATISLAESARRILSEPLVDAPGTVFKYGAPSYQVVGALVEHLTGETWQNAFNRLIAAPAGMTRTVWSRAIADGSYPAVAAQNPTLQAGLVTTLQDYTLFLGTMVEDATADYERLNSLSSRAADKLVFPHTRNIAKLYVPPGMPSGTIYNFGNWCETLDKFDNCQIVSSAGGGGTYPWIDRATGLYGVFFMRGTLINVADDFRAIRSDMIELAALPRRSRIGAVLSPTSTGSQSYLRFYNTSASAGSMQLTLTNPATGGVVGNWTSPVIAPKASPQFAMATIESEAGIAGAKPASYLITLQPRYAGGFVQHVAWRPDIGAFTNVSTCDTGVTANPRRLINVHTSILDADYPSTVVVSNLGASPSKMTLGIYDSNSGTKLGVYETADIPPSGQVNLSIQTIESGANIPTAPNRFHYNIESETVFLGYLQHLVTNRQPNLINDLTTMCKLG
jgi:CubicO group peptidase (beta-lactamase class C family)